MTFAEKLAKLTERTRPRAELSREAGLPPNAISDYINKGYLPRLDTAHKLGKVLNVSLSWLADDTAGWPPPPAAAPASACGLADDQLMFELAQRKRELSLQFVRAIEDAARVDWNAAAAMVETLLPGQGLPDQAQRALAVLASLELAFSRARQQYDLELYSVLHHDQLKGSDRSPFIYDFGGLSRIYGEFEQSSGARRFGAAVRGRPEWESSPLRQDLESYKSAAFRFHAMVASKNYIPASPTAPEQTSPTGRAEDQNDTPLLKKTLDVGGKMHVVNDKIGVSSDTGPLNVNLSKLTGNVKPIVHAPDPESRPAKKTRKMHR